MNNSIFRISLSISLFCSGVISIVLFLLAYFFVHDLKVSFILISAIITGIPVFFLLNFMLGRYVNEQITPIYKAIFQSNRSDKLTAFSFSKAEDQVVDLQQKVSDWDRSKNQEIEKLKQLEDYRKEFLGNVSHELKTPIFNIQGYILTLLDGGLDDPSINRKYLIRTEKSIDRLINIVKDLETISKHETGSLELDISTFNIVLLIKDVIDSLERLAAKKGIKIIFDKSYEKAILVVADKSRINQVITNLLTNSVFYGNENGTTKISLNDVGDKWLITVSDDGIGIEKQDLSRIFERFYRADRSRSREQGGTGLGLSIVKHILDGHKQTISVTSEIGKGTTFAFTLEKEDKS